MESKRRMEIIKAPKNREPRKNILNQAQLQLHECFKSASNLNRSLIPMFRMNTKRYQITLW